MNKKNIVDIFGKKLKKKINTETYLKLAEIPPENINKELKSFQTDLKKYNSGILLWVKQCYPNVVLLFSLIWLDLNKLNIRPNMKVVVDEYYRFIADIKRINPELFEKEIGESKKLVFAGELEPKYLSTKDPFINKLINRFISNMKTIAPQIKAYSEIISYEIIKTFEGFNKKSILDWMKLLKFLLRIKTIQKKTLQDLNKISTDVKNIYLQFKEVYNENKSIAFQKLYLILGIDSFNIEFTKYLVRLYKVSRAKKGEEIKYEAYIRIGGYDQDTRIKLKAFLENELYQKYPNLSSYILSMFNYNQYRIIAAHKNPKVRFSKGIAYFFRSGKSELPMNLNDITKEISTYSYFIDSLSLFDYIEK